MSNEKIITKIQKLKALKDRGEKNEAIVADKLIQELCEKYGIELSELFEDEKHYYKFTYKNDNQLTILTHVFWTYDIFEVHHDRESKIIFVELTNLDFIDIESKYEFHVNNYRSELKEMQNNLILAYLAKHHLFGDTIPPEKNQAKDEYSFERIKKIKGLSNALNDNYYHKQLAVKVK